MGVAKQILLSCLKLQKSVSFTFKNKSSYWNVYWENIKGEAEAYSSWIFRFLVINVWYCKLSVTFLVGEIRYPSTRKKKWSATNTVKY